MTLKMLKKITTKHTIQHYKRDPFQRKKVNVINATLPAKTECCWENIRKKTIMDISVQDVQSYPQIWKASGSMENKTMGIRDML